MKVPFFSWRNALECLLAGSGIFLLCMIGQVFYKVSGTLAAPLWPSSGLALGILLLGGWRLFPAITLGTMAATQTFGDNPLFSVAGSIANTLESLIGWFLMVRVFGFSNSMTRVRDILVLMVAGAPWGTMVSAILCTLGLVASGSVKASDIPLSSILFWTGNFLGILVFTPLVLHISQRWREGTLARITPRAFIWTTVLCVVVILGFSLKVTANNEFIAIGYLSFPLLIWLSFEWRQDVTLALGLVTVLMTAFTASGHGPLLRHDPLATYAEMTIFIAVYAISSLVLMAAVEAGRKNASMALEHRLEAIRKEAELRGIRTNLTPHFLFNSLNMIKSLINDDADKAREALVSLSLLLRRSLESANSSFIALREELASVDSYLTLQKLRFEDRLTTEILSPPDHGDFMLPPLILHQLVENAFKHGISNITGPGVVAIRTEREGGHLLIHVTNTGRMDDHLKEGIGLMSIRSQLASQYGTAAFFTIRNVREGKVHAKIRIPWEGNVAS